MGSESVGMSQQKLSQKFNISQRTVGRNLIKGNLKYYNRMKAPKYTYKQLKQEPRKCRQLYKKFRGALKVIVMDDEKYFTFSTMSIVDN